MRLSTFHVYNSDMMMLYFILGLLILAMLTEIFGKNSTWPAKTEKLLETVHDTERLAISSISIHI